MNSIVVVLVVLCVLISANTTAAVPYHDNVAEVASKTELEQRDKRGITVTLTTRTINTEVTVNVTVPATCYTTTATVKVGNTSDTIPPCKNGRSLTFPLSTLNPARPGMMYRTAFPTVNRTGKESDQMVGQTLLPSFAEEERLIPKGRVFWNLGTATVTQTNTVNSTVTDTENTVSLTINGHTCIPVDIASKASICTAKGDTRIQRPIRRGRSIQEVLPQRFP